MKTYQLGRFTEKKLQNIIRRLHNQTYMDFKVTYGVTPGGYNVTLSTEYDSDDNDILTMACFCLADD